MSTEPSAFFWSSGICDERLSLGLTATLHPRSFGTGLRVLERLQQFVEAEAADLLAWREFLERSQELRDVLLRRHEQEGSVDSPVPVVHADDVSLLERVRAQVEDLGKAQHDEWLLPNFEPFNALLGEDDLPLVVAKPDERTVVAEVEELVAGGGRARGPGCGAVGADACRP